MGGIVIEQFVPAHGAPTHGEWGPADGRALSEHADRVQAEGVSVVARDASTWALFVPFTYQDAFQAARTAVSEGCAPLEVYIDLVRRIAAWLRGR